MPGNRWVAAAAAAPCAWPACLPVLRTRPALAFPMLIPELVLLGLAFPARLLLLCRPDCCNGRPGGNQAAVRVGCGDLLGTER